MLDWLPALGARRKAQQAARALRRGAVGEASAACRAYFARRLPGAPGDLRGVDAQMAELSALCAAFRGDCREVEAIGEMIGESPHTTAVSARSGVKWLIAALQGNLDFVLKSIPSKNSMIAPHVSGFVLLAVERSSTITGKQDKMLRDHFSRSGGMAEAQARASCALAVAALRSGNRAEAVRRFAAIPASAPLFYQVLAATARQDVGAAARHVGALPAEEREASIAAAVVLVVGAPSAMCAGALEALGPHASPAVRATLAASAAVAFAREGQLREARGVLQNQTQGTPSVTLAMAEAFVALIGEDAGGAQTALRSAPTTDPTVTALRLLALALGRNRDDLLSELGTKPELLPEHRKDVTTTLLFALARTGIVPSAQDTPAWLFERPADPEALYAWGLLRLRQGDAEEASAAFSEAIGARPDLASVGDAPDAASVVLAKQHILAGKSKEAMELAVGVSSDRLKGVAARLAALAYVQLEARAQRIVLSADTLPSFIEQLARSLSPVARTRMLSVLPAEVARAHIKLLLRSGAGKEALQHLDALRSSWNGDAAFLHVAVMLSHGGMTPADAEAQLMDALALEPAHEGLRVLLSEVQTFSRGADVGLATLESAGGAVRGTFLAQALASAYRGARRGLEAKRFGFSELRRGTTVPADLMAELRDVLRFEVPARTAVGRRERIARAPLGSLVAEADLSARAHLLLARAGAAAQRDPSSRGVLDAATQRLKRALVSEDAAGARAAELEIVDIIGKVAA